MKSILFSLVLFVLTNTSKSQTYKFNGDWFGTITETGGQTLSVRLKIENNDVSQYFHDPDQDRWNPVSPVVARYNSNKNNFLYYWMNNSSVWSETQTYALSYVNDDKLYVVWSRQVNNIKENENNDVWSLQGSGYLTKR